MQPNWNRLTEEETRVIVRKGTEAPFSGAYEHHALLGVYTCKRCGAALYRSTDKFDSGCGWPAFYAEVPGSLLRIEDTSGGMARTETRCAKCNGHQGHVFKGVREFFFFLERREKLSPNSPFLSSPLSLPLKT